MTRPAMPCQFERYRRQIWRVFHTVSSARSGLARAQAHTAAARATTSSVWNSQAMVVSRPESEKWPVARPLAATNHAAQIAAPPSSTQGNAERVVWRASLRCAQSPQDEPHDRRDVGRVVRHVGREEAGEDVDEARVQRPVLGVGDQLEHEPDERRPARGSRCAAAGGSCLHPRVEVVVHDVGDEVGEDDRDAAQQEHRLHDRVVTLHHGVVRQQAQPRPVEDRLGEDRARHARSRCSS